jgi:Protein of unknown function with PCYCGC motif
MKQRVYQILALIILGGPATLAALNATKTTFTQTQTSARNLAYHDYPPAEKLPSTLDPNLFTGNYGAIVTYTLAGRIKEVLYQVPCYCPCNKLEGHESLLDCYTSKHGAMCPTCQKEVLFCYQQSAKGKKPKQIRKAIARGQAWKLDLPTLTKRFYADIQTRDTCNGRPGSTPVCNPSNH